MQQHHSIRNYAVITGAYWGFTLTDGAIRMLIVLYFHQLGYAPLTIASLFLFYEFFGIVTNLLGGWLGARFGLNTTLYSGMLLQILALFMLTVPDAYLSVVYVMFVQAISGIAKDLNKMSAKASVRYLLPDDLTQHNAGNRLFRWVALLTGSKNALKGAGFFLGGLLLSVAGFTGALYILASLLLVVLLISFVLLPSSIGKLEKKSKFKQIFSRDQRINRLSLARLFLFASRDAWFVVGLPIYLGSQLNWEHSSVGAFFAIWIILYGFVQSISPRILRRFHTGQGPDTTTAIIVVNALLIVTGLLTLSLMLVEQPLLYLLSGLAVFAVVFAINSSLHSFLIVAWSEHDKVSHNVGFYYMANAAGRLSGTILSGLSYQYAGLTGCLWVSMLLILLALISTKWLKQVET